MPDSFLRELVLCYSTLSQGPWASERSLR